MDNGVFVSEVYRRSASSGRGSSEDSSATGGSGFGGVGVGGGSTEECLFKQPLCQPLPNGCALDRPVCSILCPLYTILKLYRTSSCHPTRFPRHSFLVYSFWGRTNFYLLISNGCFNAPFSALHLRLALDWGTICIFSNSKSY
ncbi:unnamed protein product [Hydatigera taeniaeformis]|uniref:Uncharacterized protein n=1 Tax=Hydatigena taeniaeformis TaxID=6205 RepID=A0A0R3WXP7_HYDTA|nr:unnamed protein product [Hydatigera taeniaeformis]